jgi:hypothetical protein
VSTRDSVHARCLATKTDDDGRTLICRRSTGHDRKSTVELRMHYDSDADTTWLADNDVAFRGASAFQVQTSADGTTWTPRQPAPDGVGAMVPGGDHWFSDQHKAWAAANQLRNAVTWSAVRLVARDRNGDVVGEQGIL